MYQPMIIVMVLGCVLVACSYSDNADNHHAQLQSDSEEAVISDNADSQDNTESVSPDQNEYENASETSASETSVDEHEQIEEGTEEFRGFLVDNIYHSPQDGDIHYCIFIPEDYDGTEPYSLYMTLPGYEGLYFQGVAANLRYEDFGIEAQKYRSKMIVVAPQLNDWGMTSANQTIALTEYMISHYNVDRAHVFANGYSGGGETMSLVMAKRPDLFAAYLHVSSQWDGALEPVVDARTPVYIFIGENDEYYGSENAKQTYQTLRDLYQSKGLSEEEIKALAVLDVKPKDYFSSRGVNNEHGGGGLAAHDEDVMKWLFER